MSPASYPPEPRASPLRTRDLCKHAKAPDPTKYYGVICTVWLLVRLLSKDNTRAAQCGLEGPSNPQVHKSTLQTSMYTLIFL